MRITAIWERLLCIDIILAHEFFCQAFHSFKKNVTRGTRVSWSLDKFQLLAWITRILCSLWHCSRNGKTRYDEMRNIIPMFYVICQFKVRPTVFQDWRPWASADAPGRRSWNAVGVILKWQVTKNSAFGTKKERRGKNQIEHESKLTIFATLTDLFTGTGSSITIDTKRTFVAPKIYH